MHSLKAALFLGAFLSPGMLIAQQPDPNQAPAPNASQAAPAQSAPDQSVAAQPVPQQPMRHAPNPNKQARHLGKTLGLSRDQVAQIRPILADRIQQMESLQSSSSLNPRALHAQKRQIMQGSNAKIEAVLNDAQRQQFEQMLAQRRARRSGSAATPQS